MHILSTHAFAWCDQQFDPGGSFVRRNRTSTLPSLFVSDLPERSSKEAYASCSGLHLRVTQSGNKAKVAKPVVGIF